MRAEIKRSARKTIGIYILEDGRVQVRAPHGAPQDAIERFLREKKSWILENSKKKEALYQEKLAFEKKPGDTLLLFGQEVLLREKKVSHAGFDQDGFFLPEGVAFPAARVALVGIYRAIAENYLVLRTKEWAEQMALSPQAVKISGGKTRWGSCSGKNSLNFNWKLVMAEKKAIDYVVVHELCHMKEHNHSRAFWAQVAQVLPDYRERKAQLKELEKRLETENWDGN